MAAPIIRILGGTAVKARPGLQQAPCSLPGLSRLTNVHDADLIVLCCDSDLSRVPEDDACFGNGLSVNLCQELLKSFQYSREHCRKLIFEHEPEQLAKMPSEAGSPWDKSNRNYWLQGSVDSSLLHRAFGEFMSNVWTAVKGGGLAFLVIPSTLEGQRAFMVEDIMEHLHIEWDSSERAPDLNPDFQGGGDAVSRMASSLMEFVSKWPFRVGLKRGRRAPVEYAGEINCSHLCSQYVRGEVVRFMPAVGTRQGCACALAMQLGHGALFVIPEPHGLKNLIRGYLGILKSSPPQGWAARVHAREATSRITASDYAFALQANGSWLVRFKCKDEHVESAVLKNTKGMRYLAALIEHQGDETFPADLKRGYGLKKEYREWVPAKSYDTAVEDGVSEGVDVTSSSMRPTYRTIAPRPEILIQKLKRELVVVNKEIARSEKADSPPDEAVVDDLMTQGQKIASRIAQLSKGVEVSRDVKSVGKVLARILKTLRDSGCPELSTHLYSALGVLESVTLSYNPPPGMRWLVQWGAPAVNSKSRRPTR